ncbi:MAG: hypothetical protein AB7G28_18035 [Pirellulales bacterium]
MELTWKASESASGLYAAMCIHSGLPVADPRLAEAFVPSLDFALAEFETCRVPADVLLSVMTGLAARGVEDNRQLVEQSVARLIGKNSLNAAATSRIATAVGGLKAAFLSAYHQTIADDSKPLVDELLLRGRPLLEQWEARGPGLLRQIARSTEESIAVDAAEVTLVYPIIGGNGIAHRAVNTVSFEAVLTNPVESLPEVLRLAWLLTQLNLDLPMYADNIAAEHRDAVAQWATVPPVLAAAEYVELAPLSEQSLAEAIEAWRLPGGNSEQAATLLEWWSTYQDGGTSWAVALAALEQMLFVAADSS